MLEGNQLSLAIGLLACQRQLIGLNTACLQHEVFFVLFQVAFLLEIQTTSVLLTLSNLTRPALELPSSET